MMDRIFHPIMCSRMRGRRKRKVVRVATEPVTAVFTIPEASEEDSSCCEAGQINSFLRTSFPFLGRMFFRLFCFENGLLLFTIAVIFEIFAQKTLLFVCSFRRIVTE